MEILIDNTKYHLNESDEKSDIFVKQVYEKLIGIYPRISSFINQCFISYKDEYCDHEINELKYKLTKAISKDLKDQYQDTLLENQFYKLLKQEFIKTLPVALINEKNIYMNRPFLYEPKCVYTLYLLKRMNDEVNKKFEGCTELKNEDYKLLIAHNTVRSINSSLLLFSVGDDFHGYALYRGILEQTAKLILLENEDFLKDYVEFNTINQIIQYIKMGAELEKEYTDRLKDFLNKYGYDMNNVETFLLFGWAKDKKGKRIITSTKAVKEAFNNRKEIMDWYHFTSEFIHEDYVAMNYDYEHMRISAKSLLAGFASLLYEVEKESISFNNLDEKIYGYIKELRNFLFE